MWMCQKTNFYHIVIQTTVGRKNLNTQTNAFQILRFALDDNMFWFFFDTRSDINRIKNHGNIFVPLWRKQKN